MDYYSARYLEYFTKTKSLAKLEEEIKKEGNGRLITIAAAYVYYNKKDKVDPMKHPELYQYVQEFEREKDIEDHFNLNHKINHTIYVKSQYKNQIREAKEKIRTRVLDFLEETNTPLLQITKYCGLEYSHVYEFLYYSNPNKLNVDDARKMREYINEYKRISNK